MTQAKTNKTHIKARQREQQAVTLRLAGQTYQAISDVMGVTKGGVYKMVKNSMERTIKHTDESVEILKEIELHRLDRLYARMFPLAEQGSMGAVDRCLKIMERRARLLGLDAPVKTDFSLHQDEPVTFVINTMVEDAEGNKLIPPTG